MSAPGAVPFHLVDAFTDRPFAGNPAAVCLLDRPAPDAWMASVAAEVNLSETAFTWVDDDGDRQLRWWTPTAEVPLCGHATLATAHVLRDEGLVDPGGEVVFHTASGPLTARPDGAGLELDFPAYEREEINEEVRAAVGAAIAAPVDDAARFGPKLLAAVADEDAVDGGIRSVQAVRRLPAEGLVLTARTDAGYCLRYFAPVVGVDEDPVTGSAQSAAAPYWARRDDSDEWEVEQRSARGGRMWVRLSMEGRVRITGRAVSICRGQWLAPPA